MTAIKCMLYCTMAEPYLTKVVESGRYSTVGKKDMRTIGYATEGELKEASLNGTVCFECDCKEAWLLRRHSGFGDNYFSNCSCENISLQERSCLTDKQFCSYLGTYGYAYHFENVKPIDPMPITQLYRDGTMVYPLTRAPQSYCFAYRKVETTKEDYLANVGKDESRYYLQENGKFFYSEKFLVFSIRSPWVCKIANGEKDLEVRKQCVQNAGIEYK